jgi:hypothetical protein
MEHGPTDPFSFIGKPLKSTDGPSGTMQRNILLIGTEPGLPVALKLAQGGINESIAMILRFSRKQEKRRRAEYR